MLCSDIVPKISTECPANPQAPTGKAVGVVSEFENFEGIAFFLLGNQRVCMRSGALPGFLRNGVKVEVDFSAGHITLLAK